MRGSASIVIVIAVGCGGPGHNAPPAQAPPAAWHPTVGGIECYSEPDGVARDRVSIGEQFAVRVRLPQSLEQRGLTTARLYESIQLGGTTTMGRSMDLEPVTAPQVAIFRAPTFTIGVIDDLATHDLSAVDTFGVLEELDRWNGSREYLYTFGLYDRSGALLADGGCVIDAGTNGHASVVAYRRALAKAREPDNRMPATTDAPDGAWVLAQLRDRWSGGAGMAWEPLAVAISEPVWQLIRDARTNVLRQKTRWSWISFRRGDGTCFARAVQLVMSCNVDGCASPSIGLPSPLDPRGEDISRTQGFELSCAAAGAK
jgi:hypothetical protein